MAHHRPRCLRASGNARANLREYDAEPSVVVLPAGWSVVSPPTEDDIHCANFSDEEWRIAVDDTGVRITLATEREPGSGPALPFALPKDAARGRRHVLAVAGGFLVGTDAGEWRGALHWFSSDGGAHTQLANQNVHGLNVPLGADEVLASRA